MSLMQCRTRTALELSRTRRSADDRYYYETPEFDSVHAECPLFFFLFLFCLSAVFNVHWRIKLIIVNHIDAILLLTLIHWTTFVNHKPRSLSTSAGEAIPMLSLIRGIPDSSSVTLKKSLSSIQSTKLQIY